jgi:hypothetical protein
MQVHWKKRHTRQSKGDAKMARVEASAVIDRPVEEVFAFATNPENDSLWQTGGQDMGTSYDSPVEVGAKAQGESQYLGR